MATVNRNDDGSIAAITMNSVKIGEISARISREIQGAIDSAGKIKIKVPLGSYAGAYHVLQYGTMYKYCFKAAREYRNRFLVRIYGSRHESGKAQHLPGC